LYVGSGCLDKFKPGDFVACAGAGVANHSEVISVPHNLVVKLSSNKFLKQTSMVALGGIAMQGLRRANLSLGEKVCVIGLGLLGQLSVQLAKLSGLQVIGIDIDNERLKLAKQLGCDFVLNAREVDIKKEVDFKTQHYGMDATIITAAANSGEIIQQAMSVTRRKGKVVLVGDVKIDFDRNPFYSKEIDFLISCSYGPGRYDRYYESDGVDYPYSYVRWTENRNMQHFVDLVEEKKVLIDPIVSHEFDISEASQAYEKLQTKPLGLVLSYKDNNNKDEIVDNYLSEDRAIYNFKPYVSTKKEIKVAVVGAGGFAKVKLLPILSKIKNVKIDTIVDVNSEQAINIANQYGAKNTTNNLDDVCKEDSINVVVIATPHQCHFEQALTCLNTGKAVFVEKPAVVTNEEYFKLEKFLNQSDGYLYCVDFNRSFAPFNIAIKKEIKNRSTPLIINYRMNSGFIPKEHWVQDRKHGGRIIGEACHIFELFCFLTGSQPLSISVDSLNTKNSDLLSTDNFVSTINFEDGSVCSLTYTSVGSNKQNKERMEIFFDGKSIVMDDYKELTGYGLNSSFNKKSIKQDKGHEYLLKEFMKSASSDCISPISKNRILLASKISLIVDELANFGGSTKVSDYSSSELVVKKSNKNLNNNQFSL